MSTFEPDPDKSGFFRIITPQIAPVEPMNSVVVWKGEFDGQSWSVVVHGAPSDGNGYISVNPDTLPANSDCCVAVMMKAFLELKDSSK